MAGTLSKSFCVLPWNHSFVNSNGAYQVCCTSEEYHHGIPDQNNKYYNIENRPNPKEVMNSDFMKKIRLNMLNGKWSDVCKRCFETERLCGVSRRNLENIENQLLIPELIKNTRPDGTIDPVFKSLDYRLGNFCNLQCRMCGPGSSDKWLQDWNDVVPAEKKLTDDDLNYYNSLKWVDGMGLIDEVLEKIKEVEHIHFAGGEPLIASQMSKILNECIKLKIAKKISISYNTNITVLPKDILNLWKEFKEIKLLCSIDGHSELNDYIRPPSKWSVIDKNLQFLDQHAHEYGVSEILLSCTVQIYNVLNLADLYDYVGRFKFITPALSLINLNFPEYLSTQTLPRKAKLEATAKLTKIAENLVGKLDENNQYLIENIFHIMKIMNEKDSSKYLFIFKKFNDKLDKKKNVKLSIVNPELNAYLVEHYVETILENEKNSESV